MEVSLLTVNTVYIPAFVPLRILNWSPGATPLVMNVDDTEVTTAKPAVVTRSVLVVP